MISLIPRRALALCAGLVVAATWSGPGRAAESWRAYTYSQSAQIMSAKGVQAVLDEIAAETKGELKIRLAIGGSLPISATNIVQAVAENTVQMGDDAFFVGSLRVGGLLQLPSLYRTRQEYDVGLSVVLPLLREDLDKKGIVLIGQYTFPGNVIWSRRKLTSLADIAGQRFRVISPEQGAFIGAFGGTPITMGAAELAAALDRGVIDGITTATIGSGRFFKDVLKYRLNLNLNYVTALLYANKEAWSRLSPSVQETVRRVAASGFTKLEQDMMNEEGAATKKMAEEGLTVTDLSPDQVKEVESKAQVFWDNWAKEQTDREAKAIATVRAKLGR